MHQIVIRQILLMYVYHQQNACSIYRITSYNVCYTKLLRDIESLYTIAKNLNIDNIITRTWLQSLYDDSGNVTFCLKDMEDKLIRRRSIELLNKTKSNISDMSLDVSVMLEKHTVDIFNITHKSTNNKVFVITSYSIHYTKLYDSLFYFGRIFYN